MSITVTLEAKLTSKFKSKRWCNFFSSSSTRAAAKCTSSFPLWTCLFVHTRTIENSSHASILVGDRVSADILLAFQFMKWWWCLKVLLMLVWRCCDVCHRHLVTWWRLKGMLETMQDFMMMMMIMMSQRCWCYCVRYCGVCRRYLRTWWRLKGKFEEMQDFMMMMMLMMSQRCWCYCVRCCGVSQISRNLMEAHEWFKGKFEKLQDELMESRYTSQSLSVCVVLSGDLCYHAWLSVFCGLLCLS